MSILENATAHFNSIGTKEIKVPEWQTTIYVTPFTLSEKRSLLKFSKNDEVEFMARLVILKAKDKKGKPVFSLEDKSAILTNVDTIVIERLVTAIVKTDTIEEAEEK